MKQGNGTTKNYFVRSKSGNDYSDKNAKLRNSSSLQGINKSGGSQSQRGMRKFKSNGRFVDVKEKKAKAEKRERNESGCLCVAQTSDSHF
jgi:hypothetical protein